MTRVGSQRHKKKNKVVVNFVANGIVKTIILFGIVNEVLPYFVKFNLTWMDFGIDFHVMPLLELKCFVKSGSERHTLHKGVSEILLISSALFFRLR